jgi:dipeptidyl aminopeptidase/acylaminoacyl peptidase
MDAAKMASDGIELDGIDAALLAAEVVPRALSRRRVTRWAGWLPDGSLLLRARAGRATQLFRIAAPDAPTQPLTHHERSISAATLAPDGTRIAFLLEHADGARLYLLSLADRGVTRISGEAQGCADPVWSQDSRRLAFRARPAPGADATILTVEPGAAPRTLLPGRARDGTLRGLRPLGWSTDQRAVLVAVNGAAPALLSVDVDSGLDTPLATELVIEGSVRYAPGGRALYALAREREPDPRRNGDDLRQLWYVDLASGTRRAIAPTLPWDIERFAISDDGRGVALSALAAGFNVLRVLDLPSGAMLEPQGLPAGFIDEFGFDRVGQRLAFTLESADSPADVWSWDLRSRALARWTTSPARAGAVALAVPRRVSLPGWDANGRPRRTQTGWLLRPTETAPPDASRRPVWLAPRVGSATRLHPRYDSLTQHVVTGLGYVSLAPDLSAGASREALVREIGAVLVWISAQRDLDSNRIVLAVSDDAAELLLPLLTLYGERLRGGVQLRGAPQTPRGPRTTLLASPVLLLHGREDRRWGGGAALRATAAVRALGQEAWRMALPGESGDRWVRPENEERCAQAIAAFLRRCNAPREPTRVSGARSA